MRVAVVTGAAGGIGSEVCAQLVERGFHVVATDVDAEGLERLPEPVTRLVVDVTKPDFHDAILKAVDGLGRCDALVNVAGVVVTAPLADVTPEQSRLEQLVNLQAPMQLTRALFSRLSEARGVVVSVVSLGAMMPLAESAGYSASKAGLRAFMIALAMETRATGVRVAMVHPGAVDTSMLREEVRGGGSSLNFLSPPYAPQRVAAAVVRQVERPRLERFLPWYDGVLLKVGGMSTRFLVGIRPLLERMSQRGLERYRATHGLNADAAGDEPDAATDSTVSA